MFNKIFGSKKDKEKEKEKEKEKKETTNNNKNNNNKSDDKIVIITNETNTKCINNVHQKSSDLFCQNCKLSVCSKCLTLHAGHQVSDIEEIYEEIMKDSKKFTSTLRNAIEEKLKEKEENGQVFLEKVVTYYDNQVDSITNYFRELHDQLHFREVELKRELKSYHDDNSETYTTLISKIEDQVEKSKDFLNQVDKLQNQENIDCEDEKNLKLITNYYHTLEAINSRTTIPNEFNIYNFMEVPNTPKVATCLRLIKKRFQAPWSQKKSKGLDSTILYVFSKDGVEVLDTKTLVKSMVVGGDSPNSPPLLSFFWQYSVVNGVIYMFDRDKFWTIDTKSDNPEWKDGNFPINKSSSVSTIYDGKENIYIFTGYPNGTDELKDVYRFNIKDETFKKVCEKLVVSSYLTLALHEESIYLIGGYNTTNSWLNRIDRLNLKTLQTENVCMVSDSSILINSGTYVPPLNAFFVFTWTAGFHKYEPETGKYTKLAKPSTSPNYAKLFFDGDNSILLFVEHDKNIHVYDIKEDTFTTVPHGLSCEIDSASYFAMASD